MKRLLFVLAAMVCWAAMSAADTAEHKSGGLGFRSDFTGLQNASELRIDAPIGVRWWFADQKAALDLGFGVGSHKDVAADDNTLDYSVEAGLPWRLTSWNRVHVIARPGVNYTSQENFVPGTVAGTFDKITDKFVTVTGEIEAEVFLVDNVSMSASHGVGFVNYKPGESGSKSTTDWGTFGRNFTQLGFHVYLW